MNENQITMLEAMEILHVSKPTIYALIARDLLHPVRTVVKRRVYFDRAEVEALVTATVPPAPRLDAGLGSAGLTERPKTKPAKRGGK